MPSYPGTPMFAICRDRSFRIFHHAAQMPARGRDRGRDPVRYGGRQRAQDRTRPWAALILRLALPAALASGLLTTNFARAATYTVTSLANAGAGTLRNAITS